MNSFSTIVRRMRDDWDRRVAQDYRFWMSEAYRSDEDMWLSGKRDFELLIGSSEVPSNGVVVEIGCGVGRLLRFAAERFEKVFGVDVSLEAVQKARVLLEGTPHAAVILGDGVSLQQLPSAQADFVYSFATLGCVPASILISYFLEINRILKRSGRANEYTKSA